MNPKATECFQVVPAAANPRYGRIKTDQQKTCHQIWRLRHAEDPRDSYRLVGLHEPKERMVCTSSLNVIPQQTIKRSPRGFAKRRVRPL